MTEAGRDDDRGGRAFRRGFANYGGDGRRRHRDHDEVGRFTKRAVGLDRSDALDRRVVWIDEADGAGKAATPQIGQHGTAGRCSARRRADHRDRARRKQRLQQVCRHGCSLGVYLVS
ncbi:MAG TPA: hypothetical protein VFQ80_16485, partial [Thermomicrobiales bacterium]|nr:hypothetical protein [Thermomicrobiales bacterium]